MGSSSLKLVDRIDIAPCDMRITLSGEHIAKLLDVDPKRIVEDLLTVTSAFRHRKRGVETRLIIGDAQPEFDATLLRNIARAHQYFDLVRSGKPSPKSLTPTPSLNAGFSN